MFKKFMLILLLTIFILLLVGFCSKSGKESKKFDVSRPKKVAEIFSEAFVKNDSTLFHRLLLTQKEFEYWPIAKDYSDTYEEYFNEINQDFNKVRYEESEFYASSISNNPDYEVIETDVVYKIGYVKYYFDLLLESNDNTVEKIEFKINLILTSGDSWKLAELSMRLF